MPRKFEKRLTFKAIQHAKPGLHADGGNLFLRVAQTGAKYWVFRYALNGKRHDKGIGPYPDLRMDEAREVATDLRRIVRKGQDPIALDRATRSASEGRSITFSKAAELYIEAYRAGWRNAKHAQQWQNTLNEYAGPKIGGLAVADVSTEHVLEILKPIWATKTETATRVRQRVEKVMGYATTKGWRSGENPARWRGHLENLLPQAAKVRKATHYSALPWREMEAFIADLRQRPGIAAKALEFAILTAGRSGEVRGATWAEIDLQNATWTIPASRMKAGHEHRVPLSAEALALLAELPKFNDEALVFPSSKPGRPLSDMTLLAVLRRMERSDVTVHGFRSSFRDWSAEATAYPHEVAEMALAHRIKDKTEAAYRRGDLFEKRREMMQAWASWCTQKQTGNVVAIRR